MGIHEPSFPFKGPPEAVKLRFGMIELTKHTVLLHLDTYIPHGLGKRNYDS